jgi:hypothetical protein
MENEIWTYNFEESTMADKFHMHENLWNRCTGHLQLVEIRNIEWEQDGVEWIYLAQDREQ